MTIPLALTGTGTLTGGSAATSSGIASYTLQVNTVGTGDTLKANLTLNAGLTPAVAISTTSSSFDIGIATPTVGLSLSPASITYGTQETFTATVPNPATGTVTFYNNGTTSLGTGTVSSGTATFSSSTLTAGSYSITAAYSGDSNYTTATSSPQTLTISQGTVTLNWAPPSSITYRADLLTALTATASVGETTEPPSFGTASYTASLNPGGTPFAVTSPTVLDAGTYMLTLSYTPTDTTDYTTPAPVQQTLTVNQATATISINNLPASPVYNGSFAPAYTYSGNGSPTESVSSSTLTVCTVTSGTVNFVGVGTCTLTAAATATTDYLAATGSQQSFTVNQATATISINNLPASPVYNGSFTPAYSYSGNGSPTESVSSSTLTVCTVTSGTVNFVGVGTCTLTAAATATTDYLAATGSQQSFTVNQATATISINNLPASPVYNGSFTPAYSYSGNGSPTESVSSSTLTVCTVTSGTVNFVGVGTCTLTAAATATTDYLAATGSQQSFTVNQATATISINNLPASPVYNGSFTPAYTYSGNGAPTESVSSSTLSVCTVTSGTVNFVGVGTCTLTAAATATTDYLAATGSQQSFTVNQATATISIDNLPASPAYNGSFTPAYTYSGNGTPTESVSSTTLSVCTVTSGTVNFVGVGTCTLTAAATATTDYLAATGSQQSFTVNQATATISIDNLPASPVYNGSFTPAYTYSGNGTPTESVSSTTLSVCTVTSGTVNFVGVGTCTLTAAATATTDYLAATGSQQSFTVNQATQTITITNFAPPTEVYKGTFPVAATSSSGLTVALTVDAGSTGVCSLAGGTVTMNSGTGTCTIDANQAGSTNYSAATQVQTSATAAKAAPTVSWSTAPPASAAYNSQFTVAATSNSTGVIAYITSGGCSNSLGVVTMTSGTTACQVSASAEADANYTAGSVGPAGVSASTATQTITFTAPASPVTYGVSPITLSATATSDLNVAFTIDGSSTATGNIVGNVLTVTSSGTLVIDANQAGNTNYQPAAEVQRTILVNPADQIITFTPPASPVTYGVAPVTLSASATSGLPVTFSIDASSTGTGTIAGNTLTITSAGTLVIDANQSGNPDFQPGGQVQNTIVVNPASYIVKVSSDDSGTASNCTPQTTSGQGTDGSCSLRDALLEAAATGGGNISFDATTFNAPTTITLSNGSLTLPSDTTISGPTSGSGASLANLVTVDGNAASAVFTVSSGVTGASIANLTIQHGNNAGIQNAGALTLTADSIKRNHTIGSGLGGGINNSGTLVLSGSTISRNTAGGNGGGISNSGTLTLSDDTISDNGTANSGGGIYNSATLVVSDSTLSANTAATASGGGGIDNTGSGTVTLANAIVSGNSANSSADDFEGVAYTDKGGNLAGVVNGATVNATAIDLAPLDGYGGPTSTLIPLPGSPAICAGLAANIPSGLTKDERGLSNINASYLSPSTCVDAGAVQTNYKMLFTTQPSGASVATNFAAAVTLTESDSPFQPGVTIPLTLTGSGTLTGGSSTTSSGVASYTLQVNTVGTGDTLTANLALNAAHAPPVGISATSNAFGVGMTTPTVSLALSSASITYGTQETLTATLPSAATGSVTFFNNGSTALGTGPVSGGTASFSSSTLTAGSYSITAAYSGDGNYNPATSDAQSLTVNLVPATMTSPATGTTLASPSTTFTWNAGSSGTTGYYLWVGTSAGATRSGEHWPFERHQRHREPAHERINDLRAALDGLQRHDLLLQRLHLYRGQCPCRRNH